MAPSAEAVSCSHTRGGGVCCLLATLPRGHAGHATIPADATPFAPPPRILSAQVLDAAEARVKLLFESLKSDIVATRGVGVSGVKGEDGSIASKAVHSSIGM